jgi:predicted nucleic acid-binding protein
MATDPEAVYLDASVLLAFVRDEVGRSAVVRQVLVDAADGKLRARTSTLSVAEVAWGQWDDVAQAPTAEDGEKIDRLWRPGSALQLIEPSLAVMRLARDVIRRGRAAGLTRLRSADAVHLACAMALSDTARIFTYDQRFFRWAEVAGLEVSEPYVVEPPLPLG